MVTRGKEGSQRKQGVARGREWLQGVTRDYKYVSVGALFVIKQLSYPILSYPNDGLTPMEKF